VDGSAFKQLAQTACHALRPMDVQYLCALALGQSSWTLPALREHLTACCRFKKLLKRTQELRSGAAPPAGFKEPFECV
jgi:hypothetical protein